MIVKLLSMMHEACSISTESEFMIIILLLFLIYINFVCRVTHIIYRDVFLLTCSLAFVNNAVMVSVYIHTTVTMHAYKKFS